MSNILRTWLKMPCTISDLQKEFAVGRVLRCQRREPDSKQIRYSILKESSSSDRYKWEVYDYYPDQDQLPYQDQLILRFRCVNYVDAVRVYEAIIAPGTDNDWKTNFQEATRLI